MTIDVKGTKTQPQESDPAQRYVLKNADRKSRTPAILSVFLVGIALYLKSVFPSSADPEEAKAAPDEEPEGKPEPKLAQARFDEHPLLDDNATGTVKKPEGPTGGGGKLVDLVPPVEFISVRSPVVEGFRPLETDEWWKGFDPADLTASPANDNAGENGTPGHPNPGGGPDRGDGPDDDNGPDNGNGPDDGGAPEGPDGKDPTVPGGPGDGEEPQCTDGGGNEPCGQEPPCEPCDDEPCEGEPQPANRAPRVCGPIYLMDVTGCAILTIGLSDLLRNAVDPDGDVLAVENITVSSGTLTQSGDAWIFASGPLMTGPVTITYEISDGEFAVKQTVHFSVVRSFIGGTDGDDLLLGTMCADDIDGGRGDDNIDGRGGNDVLSGGAGNDHIVAGSGDDTVFGGAGDDIIFGGPENDHISGGAGNDRLFGNQGDDVIFGDDGNDHIDGGEGNDLLSGGNGDDVVIGGAGDDVIDGGSGNDLIEGGDGNDVLTDGAGEDIVLGGKGNDTVVAALDGEDDIYDGGEGCDVLDYSATTEGITVDLVNGKASGVEIGEDTISGFETVVGGQGDDHFIAGSTPTVLIGGGGENTFEFPPMETTGAAEPIIHEIMDFRVGDRIRMSKYDLFEKILDEMEDRFEDIYGDDFDDDDIPIRVNHEWVENMKRTVIEADLNRDTIYETTITMHGHHVLVIVETA
ncbi:MAG: cadherin-like domain-containing protein [Pseudaminobacter sp.]